MFGRYKSKKQYFTIHSKHRAWERYELFLTKSDLEKMAFMCRAGQHYCHLGKQSLTRSKIVLRYNNRLIPVIYDKKRHCIITLLSLKMLSPEEQQQVNEVCCS
jgi:hypothetical protein